jgi:amino-acid N-acetyltransferase
MRSAAVPETAAIAISLAGQTDVSAIVALLTLEGLPTSDIAADTAIEFLVAREGARLVGAVGLERYAATGLLRSLVVRREVRGQGTGIALTRALEAHARSTGCVSLVLLTTTADEFFAAIGYRRIGRDEVPDAVRASAEFLSLCPATAVCMVRELVP